MPEGLPSLKGRSALVTGGNRGIGLEIADGLIALGAEVTILARDATQGDMAAQALGAHLAVGDLEDPAALTAKLLGQGRTLALDDALPFAIYAGWGAIDAFLQTFSFWIIGQLDDDPRLLGRFTGVYRCLQSAGAAVSGASAPVAVASAPVAVASAASASASAASGSGTAASSATAYCWPTRCPKRSP